MKTRIFSDRVFMWPWKDEYVVYLPLNGLAFLADTKTVSFLSKLEQYSIGSMNQREVSLYQFLEHAGFFADESTLLPSTADIDSDKEFAPTDVGISTTDDCNLRCAYCYSHGGKEKEDIQWDIAKASIDFVAENAKKKKGKKFTVGFFGGGEPTKPWDIMVSIVAYARKVAKQKKLKVYLTIGTNAMLNEYQASWMAKNFDLIEISWDGPQDIQDLHRPAIHRYGSFNTMFRAMKTIEECRGTYNLRSTISDYSAPRMVEIVDFVHRNLKPSVLKFEPLKPVGRGYYSSLKSPSVSIFASEFVRALNRAKEYGITFSSTTANFSAIRSFFCGVQNGNFRITARGQVTLCTEVTTPDLPESNIFIYGWFNREKGKFVFDLEKVKKLSYRNVYTISRCKNCFCKWSCAGGCVHTGHRDILEEPDYRCLVTRATTKAIIEDYFSRGRRFYWFAPQESSLCI